MHTKAGRRNSAADATLIAMIRREADAFQRRIASLVAMLGIDDSAVAYPEGETEMMTNEVKAIDLATRCEMVCAAIEDALDEMALLRDEDDAALGEMAPHRPALMAITDHYAMKYDDDDEDNDDDEDDGSHCDIYVYDAYAVVDFGDATYRVPYEITGGEVVLAAPSDWARVEWDIADVPDAPSFAEAEMKDIEFNDDESAEAMGLLPISSAPMGTIKALGDAPTGDRIGGYAVLFGAADQTDLSPERDYFTPRTDFLLDAWKTRPILYHHAMEAATKATPVVGMWDTVRIDDLGVWIEGELKKSHKYYAAIKELIRQGALRLSSDSAPHLVQRERRPNGAHEVKRWGLIAASLTPSPAEPRMEPVIAVKGDDGAALAKARLALDLELLEAEFAMA